MNMTRDYVLELMDRVVKRTENMDFGWDWPAGVAFYGISRAYEVTGKEEYVTFLKNWIDEYIEIGIPRFTVNSMAVGYTLMTVYDYTKDEKYLKILQDKIEYLKHDAIRFGEGGTFQHTVSQNYNFPEQAWADTLFMAGLLMVKYGKKFGDEEAVADGLNQFHWHVHYLQNKNTNLFYHGWNNLSGDHMSGIYWGRANGWCAITMSEVLKLTDAFDPMFVELIDALRDQLAAVVRLQQPNGLWCTIIDDSTSYTETSASSAIAAALITFVGKSGVNLYRKYIDAAAEGLAGEIDEYGMVRNVSGGTAVMECAEDYKHIPRERIQGWGQGLMLAFLAEYYNYTGSDCDEKNK